MYTLRVLVPVLLLAAPAVQAQTIRGIVLEDGSDIPIAAASVELLRGSRVAAAAETDSAGSFVLEPRRSGAYTMRVRHLGYAGVDAQDLTIAPGEVVRLELRLGRTAIPLEPLVVTARRTGRTAGFHERRERGGYGRFIGREEIERRPGARTTDLLRMMPGVFIESRGHTNLITMRGGVVGRCLPTIYLDGMPFGQYPESGVDQMIQASSLEGVEVYTSFASAPAPIHARGACGVVAFWTHTEGTRPWTWRRAAVASGLLLLMFGVTR